MTYKHVLIGLGCVLFSAVAKASSAQTVHGLGSARHQAAAEYLAKIDAQKQCLDLIGTADVTQLEAFSLETIRPDETGLSFVQATALFGCGL